MIKKIVVKKIISAFLIKHAISVIIVFLVHLALGLYDKNAHIHVLQFMHYLSGKIVRVRARTRTHIYFDSCTT